ncbi:MAG: galactose oxidase, partial [Planctomycetota bacterium]
SADGVNWNRAMEQAPWKARIWFSAVVYRDRMWVLGGSTHGNELIVDVWHSKDGEKWSELKSDVTWSARHEHSAFVFKDRIWVAGGHARPLNSEVWSLRIPETWFKNE